MTTDRSPTPASQASRGGRRLTRVGRALSVRLRFPLIVGAAFLVVAQWDTLRTQWDRLVRGVRGADLAAQVVSGDTEYFCPMDPGVLSDWPGKCPICNMALVRRKRGDATPLPEGVVARMQFSPYRVQLAGIRTTPVGYSALQRTIEASARVVTADDPTVRLRADLLPMDRDGVTPGRPARIDLDDSRWIEGTIRAVDTAGPVEIEANQSPPGLASGQVVRVRIDVPMADREPFRSLPADPPTLRPKERRRVFACADHPDVIAEIAGECPRDNRPLHRRDLATHQRLRWWCPMHPSVVADAGGASCAECGGMALAPRVVTYRPPGQVLAVPADSVIDTGTRRVVYVERMSGMFDGVEVVLGPRCDGLFPVVSGVEPGDRVVTAGAFLIDAENRLNPALAASYFGASRRSELTTTERTPTDRALVDRQQTCPVTGKALGSMGPPVRVTVGGRVAFLCCEGCQPALEGNPERYLAKLPPAKPGP